MTFKQYSIIFSGVFLPAVAFGQVREPDLGYIAAAVVAVGEIITSLIPLVIAFGLVAFIWGVIKFIGSSHDAEARSAGLRHMGWGIVGLFAIVSVWGIVNLLAQMVGVEQITALVLPTVPLP